MINITLEDNASGLAVTRWRPKAVTINGREYDHSIILTTETVRSWAPTSMRELDRKHLLELLESAADVLILGTGTRQIFPDIALLAPIYQRGVGIEVMAGNAACHTFNILAAEGRQVVAGIIIGE